MNFHQKFPIVQLIRWNSNRTLVGRYSRIQSKMYETNLVEANGSVTRIRYESPRRIIFLPLDVNELNEKEKKDWIRMKTPKHETEKFVETEDVMIRNERKKRLSSYRNLIK
ncbi:hypothetical protein SNEBB_004029 [Seison nebaliae]|nr:hypothetical protein SNEBB_004029 [Seison nebaliae]